MMVLPEKYRKRLVTSNMQGQLNEEIRRREKVIRIFPNEDSAMRPIASCWLKSMKPGQQGRDTSTWPSLANGKTPRLNNIVPRCGALNEKSKPDGK